ncbi:hypothetical protein C0993_007056, partial [Termitomyces sp. T159_Od127]
MSLASHTDDDVTDESGIEPETESKELDEDARELTDEKSKDVQVHVVSSILRCPPTIMVLTQTAVNAGEDASWDAYEDCMESADPGESGAGRQPDPRQ